MHERHLLLMRGLIPELSELEANGYTINKISVNGSLMFDVELVHDDKPAITFSGAYKTNGGETVVSFEKMTECGDDGESQSEIADYKITRITRTHSLFEEEYRDIDDEIIDRRASIVLNDNPMFLMPYVGTVVVNHLHKYKDYKTYKKFGDRKILARFIRNQGSNVNNPTNS